MATGINSPFTNGHSHLLLSSVQHVVLLDLSYLYCALGTSSNTFHLSSNFMCFILFFIINRIAGSFRHLI